jgi:aspartyl-tRNA(Asn)/glutamyl-tRNA(Gln) amidotransferase subunit A
VSLSATALRERIVKREVTAVEVAEETLDRIEKLDGDLGCFLAIDREGAREAARECDERLDRGDAPRLLEGLPVGVKDNILVLDLPTTCGSRLLEGYSPPYEAEAVWRIRAAGGVIVGKLNLDEFGMGSSNEFSAYGPVKNPWKADRVPGGSSGGSAAAVAAGLVPLALGSDTGGSVRQPAAFCGVTGFRPSYGRVSRRGLVAFASSLDQIGPMARDMDGAARLLTAIAGEDPGDATARTGEVPAFDRTLDPAKLTLGVLGGESPPGLDVLKAAGATIREIDLPHFEYGVAVYAVVANAEASANLARFDGVRYGHRVERDDPFASIVATREAGFGDEVKRRIRIGTFALSEGYREDYYGRAQRVRTLIARDFERAFKDVDLILTPVTPTAAFRFGEKTDDPLAMYEADRLTIPASLAGLPAASVPAGFDAEGLPVGLQITGPRFADTGVIGLARAFQSLTDWHEATP